MIRIYDKTETDFNHNGLCILDSCIKCEVEEELNGIYKLELEYPLDSRDKWRNIVEGNVIKVPTLQGDQLFRIFKKKKNLNSISCIAFHIFYDLLDNFIEDTRPTNATGASAIEDLFKGTQYKHKFSVSSDISRVNTAYIIRKNPIEALLSDDDNSFLSRWGGEIVRDNFNISMKAHRGEDRGVTIRYGKNLIGLEEEIDESNVITRIMPTGLEENDTVIMLSEKYIDSPLINKYVHPKIKHFHFTELKVNSEEKVTKNDVIKMLREKVKELYEVQKVDIPIVNYKVDFIELSKTKEYEKYQILERVWLGDIITVKHERLGINLKSKVISYKYDCISNRYIGLELGNFIKNIADSMSEQDKKINQATDNLQKALSETAKIIEENQGSLDKAIEDATNKLNNALGGHVVKKNDELLIMDTTDINTATKVWRWNMNGLGYSSNGYNGKFETAITMDGKIIGKFLQGEIIRGVSLQGVEIMSVDRPTWDGGELWQKSTNVCKMTNGGLIFNSRDMVGSVFDDKLELSISGFGLKTSSYKGLNITPASDKYKCGVLNVSGTQVDGSPLNNQGGGITIKTSQGINLKTGELLLDDTVFKTHSWIQAEHTVASPRQVSHMDPVFYAWRSSDIQMLDLKNGWISKDSYPYSPRYFVDSSGVMHLMGRVYYGKVDSIIATIDGNPYQAAYMRFLVRSGAATPAGIDIDGKGNIIFRFGNAAEWIQLDGISFKVYT
ncbi:phage tail spike protein [Hathewaya histolytica]|uniref:Phage endopeptidase n=1 Tax=Hathewaya histolytica TaxID=1498 RepID=A0A4U9RA14_HATHI|nr:phage tail spike protein [Hathewaya histolytica]VTQ87033.1 phage endopeptidase [Hathewaya histolytica]